MTFDLKKNPEKLEIMRLQLKLSRQQWADMLGIQVPSLRRYIVGARQPSQTLINLATLLYNINTTVEK